MQNTTAERLPGRIQILNWRQFGDDESYARVEVFASSDRTNAQKLVADEHDVHFDGKEDTSHHAYANDDIDIADGDVMVSHNGRRFRVSIEEIPQRIFTVIGVRNGEMVYLTYSGSDQYDAIGLAARAFIANGDEHVEIVCAIEGDHEPFTAADDNRSTVCVKDAAVLADEEGLALSMPETSRSLGAPKEAASGELEVWLCPIHRSLDNARKIEPLDNCVACIRAERNYLRITVGSLRAPDTDEYDTCECGGALSYIAGPNLQAVVCPACDADSLALQQE